MMANCMHQSPDSPLYANAICYRNAICAAAESNGHCQRISEMINTLRTMSLLAISITTLSSCNQQHHRESEARPNDQPSAAQVESNRLIAADKEPGNWMSHGRTYSEQRYSPLPQVDTKNVGALGLAWSYDLQTERGIEATSIVSTLR